MIEPAAYGVAVTFGPNTWNFKHVVNALLHHEAAIEVRTNEEWLTITQRLLQDVQERQRLGTRAQRFVASQQGATARTLELLTGYLPARVQAA
jgi:3-deoxy-D-manno-octulosonic-acid transferase